MNLGNMYLSVGEYEKATDHLERSTYNSGKNLETDKGEASSYMKLGNVYESVGEYHKAKEHLERSLAIQKEIGDRSGEADSCRNLGNIFRSVGGI